MEDSNISIELQEMEVPQIVQPAIEGPADEKVAYLEPIDIADEVDETVGQGETASIEDDTVTTIDEVDETVGEGETVSTEDVVMTTLEEADPIEEATIVEAGDFEDESSEDEDSS